MLLRTQIMVCGGTGCKSCKSHKVQTKLEEVIKAKGLDKEIKVHGVGCFGLCVNGPIVLIYPNDALYEKVQEADCEEIVDNVVKQAVETFGGIDVLINCAQASEAGVPLAVHTTEQFDLAIYSGLYGAFYYMKACYPYLKETQGSVINFASGAGLFGNFGQCAYAAAKEGIRGLTRVAATEWARDGINVNIVCPLAWTSQLEQFKNAYPDAFDKNVHTPPAGHFGDAETEIGRVCVQLANPDFKYMNGETLTLEGGMGLRP